jgi:hypothetical protein
MNLSELKALLSDHPERGLRFTLPDGRLIEPDFHVTEVGHSVRNFMDCGGTVRRSEACVLQVWRAENDRDHRLRAGKLASILAMAGRVVPSDGLEVQVEYEDGVVSQYPIAGFDSASDELEFKLGRLHTDCLAREACGLADGCCSGGEECN